MTESFKGRVEVENYSAETFTIDDLDLLPVRKNVKLQIKEVYSPRKNRPDDWFELL